MINVVDCMDVFSIGIGICVFDLDGGVGGIVNIENIFVIVLIGIKKVYLVFMSNEVGKLY